MINRYTSGRAYWTWQKRTCIVFTTTIWWRDTLPLAFVYCTWIHIVFTYAFRTEHRFTNILENERFFDRSNYPKDHFLHSQSRKRHLGLMKDEHASDPIVEMCALRSKMYSVRTLSSNEERRAKGLRQFLLRELTTDDYYRCLRENTTTRHRYREITSRHHHLRTVTTTKNGLSPYEDKRYVLNCGICTLAHGHYAIELEQGERYCNCSWDGNRYCSFLSPDTAVEIK